MILKKSSKVHISLQKEKSVMLELMMIHGLKYPIRQSYLKVVLNGKYYHYYFNLINC